MTPLSVLRLTLLAAAAALLSGSVQCELDADKQAELSRWIREHFRQTGMNWVSPKMLKVGLSAGFWCSPALTLLAATRIPENAARQYALPIACPALLSMLPTGAGP